MCVDAGNCDVWDGVMFKPAIGHQKVAIFFGQTSTMCKEKRRIPACWEERHVSGDDHHPSFVEEACHDCCWLECYSNVTCQGDRRLLHHQEIMFSVVHRLGPSVICDEMASILPPINVQRSSTVLHHRYGCRGRPSCCAGMAEKRFCGHSFVVPTQLSTIRFIVDTVSLAQDFEKRHGCWSKTRTDGFLELFICAGRRRAESIDLAPLALWWCPVALLAVGTHSCITRLQ